MSIGNVIKSIQDIMRKDVGVDGDAQRISQMGWMLFLKIFSDREAEYELTQDKYKSPIPKKYLWQNWASNPEGMTGEELIEFVNNDLFKNIKLLDADIKRNPRGLVAKGVFEDAFNYMKSGQLLRQVCNKINEVNFNRKEDKHVFGDIYETLLKDLQSAGNSGEFYTPRAVTQFIVDIIDPKPVDRILDPACGTGGFLTCAIEHINKHYIKTVKDSQGLQDSVLGIEKKPLPHLLCTTNMLLHGIEVPTGIRHDNSLTKPIRDIKSSEKVDVIITNPPFGGMEEDGVEAGFPSAFRTKETANLFLIMIIEMLKPGGRAAVVLPDGFINSEGVVQRIKESLFKECNVHTIVRLPRGVFSPYTDIRTNIIFFEKGSPTIDTWFFEHPLPAHRMHLKNPCYSMSDPIQIEEFELEKKWWKKRAENDFAWNVKIEEIKMRNFDLDLPNPKKKSQDISDPHIISLQLQDINNELSKMREDISNTISSWMQI